MKNAVNYFYNIMVDDIHQNRKMFYFDYAGYRYALVEYNGNVENLLSIYNLHLEALKRGVRVHQIILNRDGQVATLINGNPYILMRVFYDKGDITLEKIYSFMNISIQFHSDNNELERSNWGTLWANKIDYLEYEISQLGQKYPEIRETFSYFVGMGETGIQLTNMVLEHNKGGNIFKSLSHDRIKYEDDLFDLYNPLNLVIDFRIRDMAEYFKHRFFAGKDISDDLKSFLYYNGLGYEESLLFLARMLYPTYYFDLYEDILAGSNRHSELKKVISLIDDYQQILRFIYKFCKGHWQIVPIEWLE